MSRITQHASQISQTKEHVFAQCQGACWEIEIQTHLCSHASLRCTWEHGGGGRESCPRCDWMETHSSTRCVCVIGRDQADGGVGTEAAGESGETHAAAEQSTLGFIPSRAPKRRSPENPEASSVLRRRRRTSQNVVKQSRRIRAQLRLCKMANCND